MKKDSIRVRAAELFDFPTDGEGGLLHIELTENREIYVENHKGILELGDNEVVLNAGRQSVRIIGQRISVLAMNACEIRLSGYIESISFIMQGC